MRHPPSEPSEPSDIIYGRWPVIEALKAGPVAKILLAQGINGKPIDEIIELARSKKIQFIWVERRRLDQLAGGGNHQGVVAYAAAIPLLSLDDVLDSIPPTKGAALLFLDSVTDPQNLGSILRS